MDDQYKWLKADEWTKLDQYTTDNQKGMPRPEVEKPIPSDAVLIDLVPPDKFTVGKVPLIDVMRNRKTQRFYTDESLTLEELSFLLWATQGIRELSEDGVRYFRNVPSGGNRHPFETYLSVHRVDGLKVGLYRYLPIEHKLLLLKEDPDIASKTAAGGRDQTRKRPNGEEYHFQRDSAVLFIWTAIPYRTAWRYGVVAPKLIAIDAGHICQNLYLAAGAIGAGTVACGAIDRKTMDKVIGVDGENEFTFYVAPVGKVSE
jgi:SagB-type dehydrogenase family enzyme